VKFIYVLIFYFFYNNFLFSSDYNDITNKFFSGRKIDNLEGVWAKTYANQGPIGCVTVFYRENNDYYQVHIDKCFVVGKVTGKQKRLSKNTYQGENAVYYYSGNVDWGPSRIEIENNLNELAITHGLKNNTFKEKWKRIWPENIESYNKSLNNN
jgi:hypothetical protein